VPGEVLRVLRTCIRRGNAHRETEPFEDRVEIAYQQIINHNVHQCYVDNDHPVGDEVNIRAEMFLEAVQEVENAVELMGGPEGIAPPIIGINARGETAVQTGFVILDRLTSAMNMEGRTVDNNPLWWKFVPLDVLYGKPVQ